MEWIIHAWCDSVSKTERHIDTGTFSHLQNQKKLWKYIKELLNTPALSTKYYFSILQWRLYYMTAFPEVHNTRVTPSAFCWSKTQNTWAVKVNGYFIILPLSEDLLFFSKPSIKRCPHWDSAKCGFLFFSAHFLPPAAHKTGALIASWPAGDFFTLTPTHTVAEIMSWNDKWLLVQSAGRALPITSFWANDFIPMNHWADRLFSLREADPGWVSWYLACPGWSS